ncbi:MAG: DEAD/DEAH box helicase [Desulfobacula sp.]|uniref:DEAD/DEAH box helicase n=1 Tax=Desulfobacula sp. TaxID=2593537 RepID=UPI001D1EC254|nr:DEAD/DEAH box helicase [Desulfobacula sp.]MBT3484379.1 DEAD/DEAH box helicase [Desulfobacula sp.]MBT3803294.1 DEAD/DEAH box helicase [Desulfobacula sp.]MBT4023740.1 DEAD/DEAH box helicase [Desulfobacula sp.]MBT4197982.1 DEAD/DEAH box helicase [Desulfobacula sp.]
MSLDEYIQSLKGYKGFAGDIVCHKTLSPGKAIYASVDPLLKNSFPPLLESLGIKKIYKHQKKAMEMIRNGIHTVISTPTASGKSLIYNLSVIDQLTCDPQSHALYLFPLKALARDQLETVQRLLLISGEQNKEAPQLKAAVYDGDISSYQKAKIRNALPHILLSNPEMLHLAMLAHHHLWEKFFKHLKYIVIDEVHTYRGVMGSNMAWVFRRLQRICRLYGSKPIFIFCSATIANPASLAKKLTGLDVSVVNESGAPFGKKEVLLMRGAEGAARTATALIHSAVHRGLRTICYTQSRKITELIAIWASQRAPSFSEMITAYRAGFLPEERRSIEKKLGTGELLAVVSTSALELGIDIGNLDLCILVGYPGTIMATWQRAGRVGRKGKDSALILIAHEDALDQYFINHPDIFFNMPPEKAIINPWNNVILKQHLECAAAELRLDNLDPFLRDTDIKKAVAELEYSGKLLKSHKGDMWYAARKSPHREVNLRGTGNSLPIFLENTKQSIGDIDRHRSFFETHEGAVYLHRGNTYFITRFDHEKGIVEAKRKDVPYFTKAHSTKFTKIIKQLDSCRVKGTRVGFGILKITEQVTGYDRRLVSNQKSIGMVSLDLPKLEFETQGLWIEIPDYIRDKIESTQMHFMGGIHALEHAAIGIMPLLVMTDRNDLGGISIPFHSQTGAAAVFIYDGAPGGLGLTLQAFKNAQELLEKTLNVIQSCSCETGCPACVHSPKCGSGNRPIDKFSAFKIVDMILNNPKKKISYKIDEPVVESIVVESIDEKSPGFDSAQIQKKYVHYGVLDIETRRSAKEVGGWNRADKMGVSCAILYDSKTKVYQEYFQEDIKALTHKLKTYDLVIGFNIIKFDYKVLSGLCDFNFFSLPTLDILLKVYERLGYRLSLDHLAGQTLGCQKSADGLMALKWWQQGKMDKIIEYCKQDVKVTRDLYVYGKKNQFLVFKNKAGHQVRVPIKW